MILVVKINSFILLTNLFSPHDIVGRKVKEVAVCPNVRRLPDLLGRTPNPPIGHTPSGLFLGAIWYQMNQPREHEMNAEQVSLGEFVKQLTARIEKNKWAMPLRDEKPWHMLFYRLKKEDFPGKPAFLEDLIFDWIGPFPICQDVSDYIHALHFTGCMSAGNPSYDAISLTRGLADKWAQENLTGALPDFMSKALEVAKEEFKLEA
jgi:hypothetical protein